jgi:hypothetical protein
MTQPTIAGFFGVNAQLLTSEESIFADSDQPVLVIKYSDLIAQGWDDPFADGGQNPERWITAIIKKMRGFSSTLTDEIPNVVVSEPLLSLESRNSLLKRRFSYSVDIYQADSGATSPDPDLV